MWKRKRRCKLCKRKLKESEDHYCMRCVKVLIHTKIMMLAHDTADYLENMPE